ncbi:MAG: hypothetical protein ACTSYI_04660 [Promethearchaeota archaeon]
MTFKKLTQEEINFSVYDNLIGMAFNKKNLQQLSDFEDDLNLSEMRDKKDKKILILFSRADNYITNIHNEIKEFNEEDFISIKNTSNSDKLWNIQLQLEESSRDFTVNELKPNDSWEYSLGKKENQSQQHLEIIEKVSKKRYLENIEAESQYYVESNDENIFFFSIFLKNNSKEALSDINITKNLPKTNINMIEANSRKGRIQEDNKRIIWKIEKLDPRETAIINIQLKLEAKPANSGTIEAQYRVNMDKTSIYTIKKFKSSIKVAQFIKINEQDENPDNWDCSLSLVNRSEYALDVNQVKLFESTKKGKEEIFGSSKTMIIHPYEEKIVFQKTIVSEKQPILSKILNFNPQFLVLTDYSCRIVVEDVRLELLEIMAEKEFLSKGIKSYENSDFGTSIVIKNQSSLPLNHVLFKEFLPKAFTVKDFSNIKLSINSKSFALRDFKGSAPIATEADDLSTITQNLMMLEGDIASLSKEKEELAHKIEELKSTENSEIPKVNLEEQEEQLQISQRDDKAKIKDLITKKEEIVESIMEYEKNVVVQTKLLEKLKEHEKIAKEIESLSGKLKKLEKSLGSAKKQEKSLNKNLAKATDDAEEKAKLEVKLAKNSEEQAEISKNIEELNKEITDKDNIIEMKTLKQIKTKISTVQDQDKESKNKITEMRESFSGMENEQNQLEETVKNNKTKLNQLKNSIDSGIQIHNDLNQAQKQLSEINDVYSHKKEEFEKLNGLKSKISEKINQKQTPEQVFDKFYDEFKQNSKDNRVNFVAKIEKTDEGNMLLIAVNNLKEIFQMINNNESLKLEYQIMALRPRNDVEYKFPTSIYFASYPLNNIQTYEISENLLPSIDITHDRKKISLGKIVDNYLEAGKFQITLLIRNFGSTLLENLKIIDALPAVAEISNSFYSFKEEAIDKGVKEILWNLDKIGPLEEIEISYLVDLGNKNYDLNDFELKIV